MKESLLEQGFIGNDIGKRIQSKTKMNLTCFFVVLSQVAAQKQEEEALLNEMEASFVDCIKKMFNNNVADGCAGDGPGVRGHAGAELAPDPAAAREGRRQLQAHVGAHQGPAGAQAAARGEGHARRTGWSSRTTTTSPPPKRKRPFINGAPVVSVCVCLGSRKKVSTLNMQVEAQNQVVRRLEEKERLLQSSLAAAEKELVLRQQAMEMHKRKAIESAQSAADLKLHLGTVESGYIIHGMYHPAALLLAIFGRDRIVTL